MKLLKERIIRDGKVLNGNILKVDSFLNHMIDTELLDEIGKEFYEYYKDKKPNKILTIESSGIAFGVAAARFFGFIPVVFAKKFSSSNMSKDVYSSLEHSHTKNVDYNIQVSKEYLNENDRVLILDDFLAKGEAMRALIDICTQANCEIVGCGAVISKVYQQGEKILKDSGYDVKVLARIKAMDEKGVEFE